MTVAAQKSQKNNNQVQPEMTEKKANLSQINILLGVSGAVAAYKAVDLASRITASGGRVKTVMTESACRLVCTKSFEAVTKSDVYTSLWDCCGEYKIGHISLVDFADIVVVAPATANIIGKIANGICDDMLSTTLCACWRKPKLLAAAMNNNMWDNPAVQKNVRTVKELGYELIGPVKGRLACGTDAVGRMSEPADILTAIETMALKIKNNKK